MTSRKAAQEAKEMKEAKKEAGICLHEGCGSEALMSPVLTYCAKHLPEDPRARARQPRNKRTP
jgi:hypothetical protein